MNNVDFDEDSDSSDEDYVPGGGAVSGDIPSEVDSDGDPEDPLSDTEETGDSKSKRTKRHKATKKKLSKNGTTVDKSQTPPEPEDKAVAEAVQEDKKKHADDLWASFKKDTGFKKKTAASESTSTTNGTSNKSTPETAHTPRTKQPDTVKITQIFEFAGEQVKVEKQVKADSAEARLSLPNSQTTTSPSASASSPADPKRKTGGLGGIGSVLNQINKKQKLSVLEKTKLDWNQYKQKEKIEDELESYKKGKDGYLERQDFLERADMRQFEIEKEVRAVERSKRVNNAP